MQTPVMYVASSLARKHAAFATSVTAVNLPSGIDPRIALRFSGVSGLPKTKGNLVTNNLLVLGSRQAEGLHPHGRLTKCW